MTQTTEFCRVRRVRPNGVGIQIWGGTEHVLSESNASILALLIQDVVDEMVVEEEPCAEEWAND